MNVFHFDKCEEQDDDQPCICDLLREQMDEDQTEALLDDYISEK